LKLWLILYVGQFIGATWGPLPYDMTECKARAARQNLEIQLIQTNPEKVAAMTAKGIDLNELKNMHFECKEQGWRPFTRKA
jgi:hypothetical protein